MKKLFAALTVFVFATCAASAQDYNIGLGVKFLGDTAGLNVKYKMNSSDALDALVTVRYKGKGFLATLLYERHIPVITSGFHFYYGAGAHIGGWEKSFSVGVDGVLGLEYKFPRIPLAVALDYKPALNFVKDFDFWWKGIGLGIRVTI